MSLKFGLEPNGESTFITKSGELEGVAGKYVFQQRNFPTNCSFFDVSTLKVRPEIALIDQVDFILALPPLSELPANITTGAVYGTLECYLISEKTIDTHDETRKFQTSFEPIEVDAGSMIVIMALAFILLLKVYSKQFLLHSCWEFIMTFLYGDVRVTPKRAGFKFLHISLLIWVLFVKIIHGGLIQTDSITIREEHGVETMSQIIERDIPMVSSKTSLCFNMLRSIAQSSHEMNLTFQAIRKESLNYLQELEGFPNLVILGEDFTLHATKIARCSSALNPVMPHRSKEPIASQILTEYFHNRLDKNQRKNLIDWGYRYIEFGFTRMPHRFAEKVSELVFRKPVSASCMQDPPMSPTASQIRMSFMIDSLWLFYMLSLLLTLVLLLEFVKFYCF